MRRRRRPLRARPRVILSIFDHEQNPYYAGGGPTVIRRIAAELASDYDVTVVTAGNRRRVEVRDGIAYHFLPVLWSGPRAGQLLWALALPFVAIFSDFDLWVESFTPPVSSNCLPLVTRRPVLGVAQALSGRAMAQRYRTSLPVKIERRLLTTYRHIVVLNESDEAQVRLASPKTGVHLIRNTVEVPRELPVRGTQLHPYGLFLGRIDVYQKGIDLLFESYQLAGDAAFPLVIAGAGAASENRKLERLLANGPLGIRWVGRVAGDEKASLLRNAAYLVVSSREESFCLAALEAMSYGVPVIHFDLPQLAWIPKGCGIRVPSFDVEAMADSLKQLSGSAVLREELGAEARAFAVESSRGTSGAYRRLVAGLLAEPNTERRESAARPAPVRRWSR
ncbi:Glycosyltransferase involved in cell wall bisynthesis [Frankineae bacterium MT45]|nr:Glycosyltransferase involved in cell wall bisynthesis [Frankineae bacterium MT45]